MILARALSEKNSNAVRSSLPRNACNTGMIESKSGVPSTMAVRLFGARSRRMVASTTKPRVPSAPMNSWRMS
ncbi:hypothetical protein D3C85_1393970 [compost metagenome]